MKTVTVKTYEGQLIETFETSESVCEALSRRGYIEPRIIFKGIGSCKGAVQFTYENK